MLDIFDANETSVASAARRCGLSQSRATHLMTDKLGAPPCTFRSWMRLRRAIGAVAFSGASLTRAAHEAGFSDAAHFTRTSRRLLGVTPRDLVAPIVHLCCEP